MSLPTNCKTCGCELSANALEGLCLDCLGRLVLEVPPANLSAPAPTLAGVTDIRPEPGGEQPGDRIGNYRLQQKIGEGGFGVVYMAEQEQPVRRRVALKVIKLGMDTRQVVARFEAERQALALMDHPNIARVLDAGATEAGRPYFVMELVKGIAITKYCNQNQLPLNARLDLFVQICHAIQHAHQKGIIHRDIKPSNVMVTMHDGVPVPKVIDFGIAKATEMRLTDKTLFTQYEQFMGTPAYMSPEQAEMTGLDIDTRSDIYSLGVLLYELLTGRPPFSNKDLVERGIEEARRTIRETEPPRPSTRLSTLAHGDLSLIAKERSADGPKLRSLVRGDLDWIVMKCLEKDRTRRYETANGLGMDVKRYLNQEPIIARPPSQVYLFQKLVRRHKSAVSAAAIVLLALIAGLGLSTWSLLRERAARTQLEQARVSETAALGLAKQKAEAEVVQRARAEDNAARARSTVTRLEIDRAEMLFDDGQSAEALAYLARVVRREPTNRVAGERIISALAHRNFCVPLFRLEHKTNVTSAEFSPDGQRVLTSSMDGTARIYDGRTGQPLVEPFQHTGEVTAAHFSHDGMRVVTVSLDKTARIWDAQTGRPVTAPLQHESDVLCADFSPDRRRVVTGSADGSMRQWNAITGALLSPTGMLTRAIKFVKYSPDGQWVVLAASPRYEGRLVNAGDGTVMTAFETGNSGTPTFPSFSRDGTRLLSSPAGGILDILGPGFASTNRVTQRLYNNAIKCARLSPDGEHVVVSSFEGAAVIRDSATFQQVGEMMRHEHWVEAIDFSPDGHRIATGSKDHTARIWEARTGRPLSEPLRHDATLVAVQFSLDGQRLLSRCEGSGVWVWEIRGDQPLTATLQQSQPVRKAVFSPDGERAATTTLQTSGRDSLVRLWDVRRAIPLLPPLSFGALDIQFSHDGRLLSAVASGNAIVWESRTGEIAAGPFGETNQQECVRFSPDGQLVLTAGPGNPVKLWRIATGSLEREFSHETAGFAQFSPNGQWIVTTSVKAARLWDWRTGKPWTEPLSHEGAVVWADVSADSQRVATLSRDQTARIWDANSGKLLHTLPHAEEPYHYNSIQFSSDGRLVVIASGNTAQIWSSHTGQPVTAPLKHDGRVNSVRFSPDGTRLVTACYDGIARLWDSATGHSVSEPLRHRNRANYAEFCPDGRWVITASDDGTARIWEVPTLTLSLSTWLADWAEAVAGQRIDERNANQSVPFDEVRRLRQTLAQVPDTDEAGRWAKWYFAENTTRKVSPASLLTVAQLVERRIEQNTLDSLQQAVRLSPTNGLAQARLAYVTLTNEASSNPRLLASADWQSRRGLELSPNEPDAWRARAQFCEHLERLSEALDAMDRAASLNPTNASFWDSKGLLLEKTNRLEEALQSYTKAIELSGPWKDQETLPALAYANRSKLNRRLNRLAEAAVDNLKARNLSQRDPRTPATLIDLSPFYNDAFDYMPPPGRHTLGGVTQFDLRGMVSVAGDPTEAAFWPDLLAIPIAQKGRRLHFLHAGWGKMKRNGTEVGVYRLHYADGQQKEISIIYGEHLRHYFETDDSKEVIALAENTKLAWIGDHPDKPRMERIRLFETTWENERPDVAIESLDFVSRRTGLMPSLFAITVEP